MTDRPNDQAWARALVWAAPVYVVLLVVMVPRSDRAPSFVAGQVLLPALVAWGVTWAVARNSQRRWSWWRYPLLVVALAGGLFLVTSARDLVQHERDVAASPGPESAPAVGELRSFGSQGRWTEVDSAAVQAEVERVQQGAAQLGIEADAVVGGTYRHSDPAGTLFFVAVNDDMSDDLPLAGSLRNVLAGGYVDDYDTYDPGAAGGLLGCGDAAAQGAQWRTCAWVGRDRTLFLRWDDRSVPADRAAELTVEFRDLALEE